MVLAAAVSLTPAVTIARVGAHGRNADRKRKRQYGGKETETQQVFGSDNHIQGFRGPIQLPN
jgi:hypothetical protein